MFFSKSWQDDNLSNVQLFSVLVVCDNKHFRCRIQQMAASEKNDQSRQLHAGGADFVWRLISEFKLPLFYFYDHSRTNSSVHLWLETFSFGLERFCTSFISTFQADDCKCTKKSPVQNSKCRYFLLEEKDHLHALFGCTVQLFIYFSRSTCWPLLILCMTWVQPPPPPPLPCA